MEVMGHTVVNATWKAIQGEAGVAQGVPPRIAPLGGEEEGQRTVWTSKGAWYPGMSDYRMGRKWKLFGQEATLNLSTHSQSPFFWTLSH